MVKRRNLSGPGYEKIVGFCDLARERTGRIPDKSDLQLQEVPIEWGWIDICCIDKRSSAELSEAINSMFKWYHNATVCYVFLADVDPTLSEDARKLRDSDWFNRGWTLQELLAPWQAVFCNSSWEVVGYKCTHQDGGRPMLGCENSNGPPLDEDIANITGIDVRYLKGPLCMFEASVACRMSWAAHRKTSRVEDIAYCLLGIFDVNIPLLYGEGGKAFFRLQEEILRTSNDQSIFAWNECFAGESMLALHPGAFHGCGIIQHNPTLPTSLYTITNRGLEMRVKAQKATRQSKLYYTFPLNYYYLPRPLPGTSQHRPPVIMELAVCNNDRNHSDQYVRSFWDNADYEVQHVAKFFPPYSRQAAREKVLYVKHRDLWHSMAEGSIHTGFSKSLRLQDWDFG
jgi:hypothetical protein